MASKVLRCAGSIKAPPIPLERERSEYPATFRFWTYRIPGLKVMWLVPTSHDRFESLRYFVVYTAI